MRTRTLIALSTGGLWLAAPAAFAQEPPPEGTTAPATEEPTEAPATPAPEATPPPAPEVAPAPALEAPASTEPSSWWEQITVGALVDSYYSLPIRSDDTELNSPSVLRTFDGENGGFEIAYAELNLSMPAKPAGFRLDLGFGPVADLTNQVAVDFGGMTLTVANETFKHIQQAYASFQLPGVDVLTVDIGRFVTTAGAEVIEAKDNWLYSRSLLFGLAIPFSHTGVRATVVASDQLTLQASLVNGWDVVTDNNTDKTFGLSGTFTSGDTSAVLTFYGGKEVDDFRVLVDGLVTQKVDPELTVNVNVDWGKDGDAQWYGVAAMGRYEVTSALRLALRAEYFDDADGVRTTPPGQPLSPVSITEVTANLAYLLGRHVELRLEGRIDIASEEIYGAPANKTQPTVQLAALAYF
jgi:Putative beta-barrel porin-2, OmpL-like. bbp2